MKSQASAGRREASESLCANEEDARSARQSNKSDKWPSAEAVSLVRRAGLPFTRGLGLSFFIRLSRNCAIRCGIISEISSKSPQLLARSGRRSGSGGFRRCEITRNLIFRDIVNDDFVRDVRAVDVELDRFLDGAILLLNPAVIGDDVERERVALGIDAMKLQLDGTDVLGRSGLGKIELEAVALAHALELFALIVITGDQAALDVEVAHGGGKLSPGGIEIFPIGGDFRLRSVEVGGDLDDLTCGFLLHFTQLLVQFGGAGLLILERLLRDAASMGQFVLRQAKFFRRNLQFSFQVGNRGIRLGQLSVEEVGALIGGVESGLCGSALRETCVCQVSRERKQEREENHDPTRSVGI